MVTQRTRTLKLLFQNTLIFVHYWHTRPLANCKHDTPCTNMIKMLLQGPWTWYCTCMLRSYMWFCINLVTDYFILSSILQMHHNLLANSMIGKYYHTYFKHSSDVLLLTHWVYIYMACFYTLADYSKFLIHHVLGNQRIYTLRNNKSTANSSPMLVNREMSSPCHPWTISKNIMPKIINNLQTKYVTV